MEHLNPRLYLGLPLLWQLIYDFCHQQVAVSSLEDNLEEANEVDASISHTRIRIFQDDLLQLVFDLLECRE